MKETLHHVPVGVNRIGTRLSWFIAFISLIALNLVALYRAVEVGL